MPPTCQYLTTPKATHRLGVGARSLQRWTKSGHLTPDFRTPGGHARWAVDRVVGELASKVKQMDEEMGS